MVEVELSDSVEQEVQLEKDQRLAVLLRDMGLLDADDLEKALAQCQRRHEHLLQVLLIDGTLSFEVLQDLLLDARLPVAVTESNATIAVVDGGATEGMEGAFDAPRIDDERLQAFLLAQGRLTQGQLDAAIAEQQHTGHPLWRTLINLELLTPQDMMQILKSQGEPVRSQDRLVAEALQAAHRLTPDQLKQIEQERQVRRKSLAQLCIEKGWLSRVEMGRLLEQQVHLPFVDVHRLTIDHGLLRVLPVSYLREHQVLPVRLDGEELWLAMVDPQNLSVVDSVALLTGHRVRPMLALEADIQERLEAVEGTQSPEGRLTRRREAEWRTLEVDETGTAVQLANTILEGAVRARATDIHVEPQIPRMRVRYRIDGMLFDVLTVPPALQMPLISRLKILADMDITERRLPQDGHITSQIGGQEYNLRVATIPTTLGEKLVIRLLSKSNVLTGLKQLGLEPEDEARLRSLIARPQGMILATGPIGSGKTTTLYAALNEVNILTNNILTIEDPVEYQLAGINQVEVDPKIGLTFASGLRSILRQDADILMVGEIRDTETATVAVRAALTGQQFFSTLHTNDAPGAITTLGNFGIQPYLIASSLSGVVAQRLVRRICSACRRWYTPSAAVLRQFGLGTQRSEYRFAYGVGCEECYHTGYLGRTGIFEILKVSDGIKHLIIERASERELQGLAIREGMSTLQQSGVKKILQGLTTPQEVVREVLL